MASMHPYIPNADESIMHKMLNEIGVNGIEDLFKDIPPDLQAKASLVIPERMSEMEVKKRLEQLLGKNRSASEMLCFLGAGVWRHYVPAAIDAIVTRGEFLTSYTPYQPEISQGMLQSLFEYQSMICELTGMDYANSSMYDWSTALGEAARMTARVTGRYEFIVPHYIHPERLATLQAFSEPADIKIVQVAQDKRTGAFNLSDLKEKLSQRTGGVYLEYPSYLGFVEEAGDEIEKLVHNVGALLVVGCEPISLGVLKSPGEFGADVVVGEGQPLGSYMNYGGPLLGIFGCRGESVLRQMPGRIIGKTTTQDETQAAYCMALQTREQHIRREKATSNICTNEALLALAASMYLSLLGPKGIIQLCSIIMERTQYAIKCLGDLPGVTVPKFDAFHFMEFTVNFDKAGKKVSEINDELLKVGIQGGLDISKYHPELGQSALYSVTEVHSHEDIDALTDKLRRTLEA